MTTTASQSWRVEVEAVQDVYRPRRRLDKASAKVRKTIGSWWSRTESADGSSVVGSSMGPGGDSVSSDSDDAPIGESLMHAFDGESIDPSLSSGERRKDSTRLIVEVAVHPVRKRSRAIFHTSDQVVEVGQVFHMPVPSDQEPMVIRLLRVRTLRTKELGAGVVAAATGLQTVVVLKEGRPRGTVRVIVTPDMTDATPVADTERDNYKSFKASKRRELRAVQSSAPGLGTCSVEIRKVSGMAPRASRPYFAVYYDGHEQWADDFANRSASDLTFTFPLNDVQADVRLYCYETGSSAPLGRILLPVTDVVWHLATVPTKQRAKNVWKAGMFQKIYTCQFFPLSPVGDGSKLGGTFEDHFAPVFRGKGMLKADVFGAVEVKLQVILETGLFMTYAKDMWGNMRLSVRDEMQWRRKRRLPSEELTADSLSAEGLFDLAKVDLKQIHHNLARVNWIVKAECGGIVRWLREQKLRAYCSAALWLALCLLGVLPPPKWTLPLVGWVVLLVHGYLTSVQRDRDWKAGAAEAAAVAVDPQHYFGRTASSSSPASRAGSSAKRRPSSAPAQDCRIPFLTWQEELAKDGFSTKVAKMKKDLEDLERNTSTFASFLEKLSNAFTFADGTATLVCFAFALVPVILGSGLLFLVGRLDSENRWAWGIVGTIIILAISKRPRQRMQVGVAQKDPMRRVRYLNDAMCFVPDHEQDAHRYISTRVQCTDRRHV
mmetsp:Transcript_34925/g.91377  ORF Transcript_34925/g.91377 Transcript_34925/m.91377 type:complete len:717 (+) Transcript_34925:51-2201(+)